MEIDILYAIKIILVTFIFAVILMPVMKKIAHHIGAIDKPSTAEGNRHIHKKEIPKLGALGIFISFLLGYMLFGEESIRMNSILIGSFIIILTGIIDDIKPLKSSYKLIGHILAAAIITFYGEILLNNITAFGYAFDFGLWSYPLTIIFIVACANIVNLIDGLDGLSGGIAVIFFATVAYIGFFQGRGESLVMILTLIMIGSTLGFLIHNSYPAKIFAGDCCTFIGFIIAVITLLEFKAAALTSFFVPVLILAIPVLDTLFAIIRRLLKKQPPFKADKEHLHHQLLGMNFSQRKTVFIIYFINILFAVATVFYVLGDPLYAQIIYVILLIIVILFVIKTSIISDKPQKITKEVIKKIKHNS